MCSAFIFQPDFQRKLCLFDHATCGYTYVPLQSFETPGHLVQLWQSKRELRDMKFVQILQKPMQGRESTIFCSEGTVLLDRRESPLKKSYFGYDDDGKTFGQSLGLTRHATTQHQLPSGCMCPAARATAPFISRSMEYLHHALLQLPWVNLGQAWAMGMICNSS